MAGGEEDQSMETLFKFVGLDYAAQFERDGYILVKDGVSAEFLDYTRREIRRCARDAVDLSPKVDERRLKQQYLFEFPDDPDRIIELVTTIGELTGLPADELVLSERHLKIYRADAPQNPPPHKDRRATQIAVGIPLEIPRVSQLFLYPHTQRGENVFDSYDAFIRSLPVAERPENALKGITPVVLDTRPGDLVAFWGSSIFHERMRAAGSEILYLKFNALGLDPMGENLPMLPLKSWRRAPAFGGAPVSPSVTAGAPGGSP
jgi:hypothetical protein